MQEIKTSKALEMGSRKKIKKVIPSKGRFITWYLSLNVNDKIAFKSFCYHYGRMRMTLQDLLRYPYFWQLGPLAKKNAVDDGYTWL